MPETSATYAAFLTFAFVSSITPGPNNLMILASGAAFGWQRTLPHIVGTLLGFTIMVAAVTLGLGTLLGQNPNALDVMRYAGAAWLLWLAWRLAQPALQRPSRAASVAEPPADARPMTAMQAALFQWVNPKAWTMIVGASAAFSGLSSEPVQRAAVMTLTFLAVAPICIAPWLLAGNAVKRLMLNGAHARLISLAMACIVAVTAITTVAAG
ncbi:LysE family translocator [Roseibacterium beibuensis]|uniref:LysE family translocator n=1 Tax=[Roseibacterium] beibuensis TaxID=1193142 RepID=A0ABP9LLE3_9RHOB|nr:LysE family translocator [Roseibacterium beibuensis]MCS6626862.1 LysE family translocator [Roseibacterium beibuensis]